MIDLFFAVNAPLLQWNTTGITVAGVTGVTSLAADNLQLPWDLVVDWANTIYVTDRYNQRVIKTVENSIELVKKKL
jgi:precorrin-4 methylase